MKTLIHLIFLFQLVALGFMPLAEGSVFSSCLSQREVPLIRREENVSASVIFRKHLGAPNPTRWAKALPSTANAEKFLNSEAWQNVRRDIIRQYGSGQQVMQNLEFREFLFRRAIKTNNVAHSRSLNTKGNLAEVLMDDFYRKDGWEVMDGKRGRNGFDGLYVKRDSRGNISSFIIADAKSGNAKLSMTKCGKQLSSEWNQCNIKKLIKQELGKSPVNSRRITDLEQILEMEKTGKGRKPRVFSTKIVKTGDRIEYVISHLDANEELMSRIRYDLKKVDGPYQRKIYRRLREQIAIYAPDKADKIVESFKKKVVSGKVSSDSDLYAHVKEHLTDKRLAAAVSQELGEVPPRGSLARRMGNRVVHHSGKLGNSTALVGMLVAHSITSGKIDAKAAWSLSGAFVIDAGSALASEKAMAYISEKGSRSWVERTLASQNKKLTEKAITSGISKLAPNVGRVLGVGFAGVASAVSAGTWIYAYNAGNVSQTEMLIHVGISAGGGAAAALAIWVGGGATMGPVGIVGGIVIGSVVVGIDLAYTYFVGKEKERLRKVEAEHLAAWETEHARRIREKDIRRLEERIRCWQERIVAPCTPTVISCPAS